MGGSLCAHTCASVRVSVSCVYTRACMCARAVLVHVHVHAVCARACVFVCVSAFVRVCGWGGG